MSILRDFIVANEMLWKMSYNSKNSTEVFDWLCPSHLEFCFGFGRSFSKAVSCLAGNLMSRILMLAFIIYIYIYCFFGHKKIEKQVWVSFFTFSSFIQKSTFGRSNKNKPSQLKIWNTYGPQIQWKCKLKLFFWAGQIEARSISSQILRLTFSKKNSS
jgi:hypothetical protein